jgi:hypothetical protein
VVPRAGLDKEARGKIFSPLPGIEPRSPGRPARRLSYPTHSKIITTIFNLINPLTAYYELYRRQDPQRSN